MTRTHVRALGVFEPTPKALDERPTGELAEAAEAAVEQARRRASARLSKWLPADLMPEFGAYFTETAFRPAGTLPNGVPRFDIDDVLNRLCAVPRAVAVAGGAGAPAAQVELRTTAGPTDGAYLGDRPEPESPRILFSPSRLQEALDRGLSLGIRQFDWQFREWAPIVDDIATVTGSDIFTKLFLAGGDESVTDWHRDQSDVVVTVLAGAKRFEVAPATAREEEPTVEVVAELRPGSGLLLPRSRLHCATPLGRTSALLSIGVMRHGDWAFRSVAPTHLGFETYPRSPALYRLMLRSHVPAALPAPDRAAPRGWRGRFPGGIVVTRASREEVEVVAAGTRFAASVPAVRALLAVHASGVADIEELGAVAGLDEAACRDLMATLARADLVTPC